MTGRNIGDRISGNISGDISGQVAIGKSISQTQQTGLSKSTEVTSEELNLLRKLFEDLKTQVASEVEPSRQASALERIDELQEAVTAETPDLTTMEYVKRWFMKHLPTISGAVTSVIIHPIVGKLVEVSGDVAAEEFRRRFQD